jgi:murein DD-endopeptidase MepM/ murein hydrolase activator NlpD
MSEVWVSPVTGKPEVWGGGWFDSNPYGNLYRINNAGARHVHTGADLNLNKPHWNADAHAPVYAIADGVVTFAQRVPGSWGNVIVIHHELPIGNKVHSRYGHVETLLVKKGDHVAAGKHIANVGNAFGYYGEGFHLHFDISASGILETHPAHWCNADADCVRANYVNPGVWLKERIKMDEVAALREVLAQLPDTLNAEVDVPHVRKFIVPISVLKRGVEPASAPLMRVRETLNVRRGPGQQVIATLKAGDLVRVGESAEQGGFKWSRLTEINGTIVPDARWVARQWLESV